MNKDQMTHADELTDRLLDGTLTDAEWLELESLFATNPAARADHFALLELEAELRGLRSEFDLSEQTLVKVKAARAEKTAKAVLAEIANLPSPEWAAKPSVFSLAKRNRRLIYGFGGLAAIAAALLMGIWLGGQPAQPEKTPSNENLATTNSENARLTTSLGSVELLTPQGEVLPAPEGRVVPPGHTLRTVGEDSLASVEMPDRTTVDIAPDSVVRFVMMGNANTKPRLFLAAGSLTAVVPAEVAGRPAAVATGGAEVFARMGTFVVSSA